MTRTEAARWYLVLALAGTVVSALAGSMIGILIGSNYIFIALAATAIDLIKKGERHERRLDSINQPENRHS